MCFNIIQLLISSLVETSKETNSLSLFKMKFVLALFALIAGASASTIISAPLLAQATVPVATGFVGSYPTSRFTRTEWKQPGATIIQPALTPVQTLTPGYTTVHTQAASPIIAAAPLHAPLTAAYASPYAASPYVASLASPIHAPLTLIR